MNCVLVLFLLVFASSQSYAIDVGDGSDGTCDTAGSANRTLNSSKRTYQCTSLTINSNSTVFKGIGGSAVIIKVTGDVTIDSGATLDLSGASGTEGNATGPSIAGGLGGAGGFAGGNGTGSHGNNGSGQGAGLKGFHVAATITKSFGGGGGGASYKNVSSTTPTNGSPDNGSSPSSPSSAGSNGSTYGNESSFDIGLFVGGSGGASGGAGDDGGSNTYYGSSGGGGGGAVIIIAGGKIDINGTIKTNGGNGGGTAGAIGNGGGGAGSGGSIWLMANGNISLYGNGSIFSNGGTGGINSTSGLGDYGVGGNGGDGRIRLDDQDGVIDNFGTGSISPSAYSTTFKSTALTSSFTTNEFKSAVSCGRVSLENKYNFILNFVFAFSIVGFFASLSRRNKHI